MLKFPLRMKKSLMTDVESELLKEKIIDWGATLAGFGDVSVGLAPELKHMPNAIALAVKHPRYGGINKSGSMIVYSSHYEEVDHVLESVQKKIITFLKARGWRTLAIPPDSAKTDKSFISKLYSLFPHKTAATCSGLGWIGKSGLLVNREYGARMSWATVLTDAPLLVSKTPYTESDCGNCSRCVDACPASAIRDIIWKRGDKAEVFIDVDACAEYMNQTVKVFQKHICGVCVLVCPYGK
ncbi:4Fe-4S double cluster binding domain-containing protein [Phosphitispora sp. TUW77]|uniref:4Fe-4S double cluster binding domain-containing protein n=1 Tax=Phosphitispora sp. TUW77 TaxID=3152361 RepID=UPI003AB3B338